MQLICPQSHLCALELAGIDMIPLVPIRPFKAELGFVLKAFVLELIV